MLEKAKLETYKARECQTDQHFTINESLSRLRLTTVDGNWKLMRGQLMGWRTFIHRKLWLTLKFASVAFFFFFFSLSLFLCFFKYIYIYIYFLITVTASSQIFEVNQICCRKPSACFDRIDLIRRPSWKWNLSVRKFCCFKFISIVWNGVVRNLFVLLGDHKGKSNNNNNKNTYEATGKTNKWLT